MRHLPGSGNGHLADTPRNGDFARYVEDLVAQQAKALAGGQQMTPVPRQQPKPPAQPTRAQARAAELRTPPVGATPQNVKTTARTVALDSWEDQQEKLKDGAPPMPGKGFKIPPFLIFMVVIVVLGATSQFGIDVTWPVFILFWLYVLSRMVRSVIGAFRGGKPGQPPQRK